MEREVKKPEIFSLPITFIIKQTLEYGNRLPPFLFFDSDQVSDLPEIQSLFLYSSVKSPKETGRLPSLWFFLQTEDSKQWKEVSFKSIVDQGKEVEKKEFLMACLFSLIIEKGPKTKGILFLNPLVILSCPNSTDEEDAMGFLLCISCPILFQLIKRIKDEDPLPLILFLLVTIKREKFYPIKIFPFQVLKKRPGKVPLFRTCELVPGIGEKRPEKRFALEMPGCL